MIIGEQREREREGGGDRYNIYEMYILDNEREQEIS